MLQEPKQLLRVHKRKQTVLQRRRLMLRLQQLKHVRLLLKGVLLLLCVRQQRGLVLKLLACVTHLRMPKDVLQPPVLKLILR
jgi:hypothetical protein